MYRFLIFAFILSTFNHSCLFAQTCNVPLNTPETITWNPNNTEFLKMNRHGIRDYDYNPLVPIDLWMQLKPYFLPAYYPTKRKLDELFQNNRATLSKETLIEAGFNIKHRNRPFNAWIATHDAFKGLVFKVYLDNQYAIPEWKMWLRRIKGVEVIQACLQKHGYTEFATPRKWIYPLPLDPSPPNGEYNRKNFILVEDNMHVLRGKHNVEAYQNISKELFEKLFVIMSECQLGDCVYIGNMPFTEKGKIAFIDTELYFTGQAPEFVRLKEYLSPEMQVHLDKLIHERALQGL